MVTAAHGLPPGAASCLRPVSQPSGLPPPPKPPIPFGPWVGSKGVAGCAYYMGLQVLYHVLKEKKLHQPKLTRADAPLEVRTCKGVLVPAPRSLPVHNIIFRSACPGSNFPHVGIPGAANLKKEETKATFKAARRKTKNALTTATRGQVTKTRKNEILAPFQETVYPCPD